MPAAAPRLDERLVRFIHGSPPLVSPAEITRGVGNLAWELGLQRPSYQQVRVLAQARRPPKRIDARTLVKVIDTLYEYPAPLLGDWYLRHTRGPLRS